MGAGSYGDPPGQSGQSGDWPGPADVDPGQAGGYNPPPGGYGPPGAYNPPPGGYGPPGAYNPPPGGYVPAGPWPQRVGRPTNSLAIAALCCGIGVFIAGPFAGLAAIVLAAISLRQISETGEDGRGLAITGMVLGIVSMVLAVVVVLLVLVALAHVSST